MGDKAKGFQENQVKEEVIVDKTTTPPINLAREKATLHHNLLLLPMAQVKDTAMDPAKATLLLIVHMAQVKDTVMDPAKATVEVLTRVEKATQLLIVHMAQVKDTAMDKAKGFQENQVK